jgi:hypothetical protein
MQAHVLNTIPQQHTRARTHTHTVSFQSNDVNGAQNSEFLLLFSNFIIDALHPVSRPAPADCPVPPE